MNTELKYALIFAVMQLAWLELEFVSGLQTLHKDIHQVVSVLVAIPTAVIMVIGIQAKKKKLGGTISFQQSFRTGVYISIIGALFSPLTMLIFDKLINPDFFTDFQNYVIGKGMMNVEQAKEYFNLKNYMIQSALGAMVMGTVSTGIIAAVIKMKNEE